MYIYIYMTYVSSHGHINIYYIYRAYMCIYLCMKTIYEYIIYTYIYIYPCHVNLMLSLAAMSGEERISSHDCWSHFFRSSKEEDPWGHRPL